MGFSENFLWGAAGSAYQTEGAYDEDGEVPGIWDALSSGHVKHGENGNTACDFYHRYEGDIRLMKETGLKSYRFSVSWPRVIRNAEGAVNEKGLSFYRELAGALREAGIEPVCTLYHWNLPLWAHERGGWKNGEIVSWFSRFSRIVCDALSDRVRYWITINEPQCFVYCGYRSGEHAPFEKNGARAIRAIVRNVLLAHGSAVKILRERAKLPPRIGFSPTSICSPPANGSAVETEYSRSYMFSERSRVLSTVWWCDPVFLRKVPSGLRDTLSEEDLDRIGQPLDFYGYNVYTADNNEAPEGRTNYRQGMARTATGWGVTPEIMYWTAKFLYERYGLPLLVTENGMANCDWETEDGGVHDPQRTDFIRQYLKWLRRAADEGVPVLGYHYWSFLDNFEWAEGYDKRYGLIYVDYKTQRRIRKDSAGFYSEVIRTNGENVQK